MHKVKLKLAIIQFTVGRVKSNKFIVLSKHKKWINTDLERFSNDLRKTETTGITLANHNRGNSAMNQSEQTQIHVTGAKRGKMRASNSRLVLIASHWLRK